MNVRLGEPDLKGTKFTMQETGNTLELSSNGIAIGVESDFKFKYIISVNG